MEDVITAKKTAHSTIATLQKCQNEEGFHLVGSRAQILSDEIRKEIAGTRFSLLDAAAPRAKAPSRRLQFLISESFSTTLHHQATPESHYQVTAYYQTLDKVLSGIKNRLETNYQHILCALADVVLSQTPSEDSFSLVSSLDKAILEVEVKIFQNFLFDNPVPFEGNQAATVVSTLYENSLHEVLPVFYKTISIMATIPATSCSAERSFSGLRHVKTYLRLTMGQGGLSSIALLAMERVYTNRTIENDIEKIIDVFSGRSHRISLFFFEILYNTFKASKQHSAVE